VGLFLLIFLTVTLGIAAGWEVVSGLLFRDADRVRHRLAQEFGKEQEPVVGSLLFKNLDQLAAAPSPGGRDPESAAPLAQAIGINGKLQALLERANLPLRPQHLLGFAASVGLVLGLAGTFLVGLYAGLPLAFAGGAAPIVFVHLQGKARQNKYLKQLPNAFELMARVIRAGQSVPQALQAVADAFEDPLARDFANCQKQQNLGLRADVAFQEMARRSGILEMRIFAMAMLIQRQTGGNLSDVLERLAGLIRSRLRLRQQVRTLTAEGRMQGWTLVVLPFIVFAAMLVINRKYAEVLFEHSSLVIGTLVSMGIGMWWIRKIVNFET
jgi:tight adherence protein B